MHSTNSYGGDKFHYTYLLIGHEINLKGTLNALLYGTLHTFANGYRCSVLIRYIDIGIQFIWQNNEDPDETFYSISFKHIKWENPPE